MRYLSAKMLLERNASQLNYAFRKPSEGVKKATDKQKKGDEFAKLHTKDSSYSEMGSHVIRGKTRINFVFDEVVDRPRRMILVEHKMEHFIRCTGLTATEYSQDQVAFYASLMSYLVTGEANYELVAELRSAKYTGADYALVCDKPCRFILNFGGSYYEIVLKDGGAPKILQFFMTKARASEDYEKARKFDAKYGRAETHEYLSQFYSIRTLKERRGF